MRTPLYSWCLFSQGIPWIWLAPFWGQMPIERLWPGCTDKWSGTCILLSPPRGACYRRPLPPWSRGLCTSSGNFQHPSFYQTTNSYGSHFVHDLIAIGQGCWAKTSTLCETGRFETCKAWAAAWCFVRTLYCQICRLTSAGIPPQLRCSARIAEGPYWLEDGCLRKWHWLEAFAFRDGGSCRQCARKWIQSACFFSMRWSSDCRRVEWWGPWTRWPGALYPSLLNCSLWCRPTPISIKCIQTIAQAASLRFGENPDHRLSALQSIARF